MKKIIIIIVSLSSFFISSDIVYAEQGCRKVESQLEYAKKYNANRIKGLQRTPFSVKTRCDGEYYLHSPGAKEYYPTDQKIVILMKALLKAYN